MTVKKLILSHLSHGRADYKGNIEDFLRKEYGTLADCTSRRLRELVNEGKLTREMDTKGLTMYRLAPSLSLRSLESGIMPVGEVQQTLFIDTRGWLRAERFREI